MSRPEDLTPPDPQSLSEQRKAELRARLLSSAQPPRRRDSRWLVPGLSAAAVLAIVAATGVIVGIHDDGDRSGPANGFAPAAGGGTVTSSKPQPGRPHAQGAPTKVPATVSKRHVGQRSGLPFGFLGDSTTCEQEIANLGDPALDDTVSVTAERTYGEYTTSLYETKSAWIVCDDFAAADGGAPTLFSPHHKGDAYTADLDAVGVSENALMGGGVQFLAAGRDFDGVQAISYAFPDGHSEPAVVGANGLWSMTYLPTSGPLVDPDVNETTLDPIQVTVDYTDGHTDTFDLGWGTNTCAQVNHGC